MKIVFLSNFLVHHQTEFCETLYRLTDGNFTFIATAKIPLERLKLGYSDYSEKKLPYYLQISSDDESSDAARLINEADAVIIGSAPLSLVEKRICDGKLTFIYSERIFKDAIGSAKAILKGTVKNRYVLAGRRDNVSLLCAGAFLPDEMRFLNTFRGRMYRFGYFPPFVECAAKTELSSPIEILWCGRIIKYKRPEFALRLAMHLKKKNINAHISIVGTGKNENKIRKIIAARGLEHIVTMCGAMSPENVREKMHSADIFIFTSNREEGWGAVLNEAMNAQCAVIAANKIGAVPFLIDEGTNGLSFKSSSCRDMCEITERLCRDPAKITMLQSNAYRTIQDEWNATVAAKRFYNLALAKLNGDDSPYESGPCSKINY